MEKCFRCSRADDEVRLFDGFYGMENVKVCERCSLIENMPVIKVHNSVEFDRNTHQTVRQRLSHLAGLEAEKKEKTIHEKLKDLDEQPELEKPENITFKLVENFHWHILRERRRKCLSQKQLAEVIKEKEEVIKMIEKNVLPKGALEILQKLERFFGINLIKHRGYEKKEVILESPTLENDLKEAIAPKLNVPLIEKKVNVEPVISKIEKKQLQFRPEDLPPPFIPILEDSLDDPVHFKKIQDKEAEEMVGIAIKEETNPVLIKKEQIAGSPLKLVDFKRHNSEEITLADMKRMQERVDLDSPKKDKIQIGREQTEDYGKQEAEIIKKTAYPRYSPPISKMPDTKKVPSIYDLMKKKQERDKELVGREIDLTREEKDKV